MAETPPPASEPAETDMAGRQIGDFQLLRRLGSGAMADVYLAEQLSLKRPVAVKILKRHLASDSTYVQRFQNEAQAAASLVHANIVQIYDVGCADGVQYIAQEYVQGQNLSEYMSRKGPPSLKLAMRIMRQVAAALNKAAERGIVHRDIKPDNIMLARSGEVKVADFGLARVISDDETANLTQVGVTMGTPLYMSPEQVEGRHLDPRSDIYSFGVTCYHMLAGKPPFGGETALSVAVHHLKTDPDRLENLRPDLPVDLCRIVHRMLAKSVSERYANPHELLRDLRALRYEGAEEGWDELDVDWDVEELKDIQARTQATQQLSALMHRSTLMRPSKRMRTIAVVVGCVAAFGIGIAWSLFGREPFLLAEGAEQTVPRFETARAQLEYALFNPNDSEEALKCVGRYFPEPKDEYYVRLANQELARLYLAQTRLDEAYALFDSFALMGETERSFRAFGLAGKAVVLMWGDHYDSAGKVLAEFDSYRNDLEDRSMGRILAAVLSVKQSQLRQQDAQATIEFLHEQFPPEEEEPPDEPNADES